MASACRGEARLHINAPADRIWALLVDVERMGEWSPECIRVEWLDGATSPAVPGTRFQGWNHYQNRVRPMRWSVTCEVTSADPGRELAWSTVFGERQAVRWVYRLEPVDDGTDVTETFEVMWLPPLARFFEDIWMRDRDRRRHAAMQQTLERIKVAAEASF